MVGKGSVNHNSRQFHAANTDPERSGLNRSYCNENIRQVYHEMFDGAISRYNDKQTRNDRVIDDYYEKIRSGKQEKPFHEIILQIGNKDDMNAQTENGELAVKVLDEYIQSFQSRNPNMRVFSAHLHMDEATPHLHIDFVPFTTGSKRGLDTRVSLKQALAAQGFTGGSRQETEWNQWVESEKEQLAAAMERHGIEWEQKGTHKKHLSVLNYEKEMRAEEIAELEDKLHDKKLEFNTVAKRIANLDKAEESIESISQKIYHEPEYQLAEPPTLMSAKNYRTKFAMPLVKKLKSLIKSTLVRYFAAVDDYQRLNQTNGRLYKDNERLSNSNEKLSAENTRLRAENRDYALLRKVFGSEQINGLLEQARTIQQEQKRPARSRGYDRGR
ncbi:MAG: plasmid recombination protein [Clostridiales bacterium]|nr:plasmid recombination protein [Clostridiales bacterium]